ncbi:MAG TPA: AgmX/PglI C-terminal domain-containing protein [Polyangia bacterium]|nr:AgmX/PglI C-terminal domain-containing protein [Polyangia bacterium]
MRRIPLVLLALAAAMPSRARAAGDTALVSRADEILRKAQLVRDPSERYALADEAQALCEKAVAEAPRDPVPRVHLARALSISDPLHPEACRPGACERAVSELKRARELDGGGAEAERIASELGIVYSRLGAFEEALGEYDRALKLVEAERLPDRFDTLDNKSVLYGNSAETLMALHRLDQAIARYRLAEHHATAGDIEWQLAQWGLGVALDRDEQGEKAREAVKLALDRDPAMGHLSDENVFFEPAGDKYYYLALGHEVSGDRDEAIAAWKRFVSSSPSSPWLRRARAHLERLEREPRSAGESERARVIVGEPLRSMHALRAVEDLRRALRRAEEDLRLCYQRALRSEKVAGDLELELELFPSGVVAGRPRVWDTNVDSTALKQCVERVAGGWRFPPIDTQELESVRIPIHFGALK